MATTTASAGSTAAVQQTASSDGSTGTGASPKPLKEMAPLPGKNRVLIIVENQSVPFDPRVWREARALQENGYEVNVICPRRSGYTKGFEIMEGVRVYRHPTPAEGRTPGGYFWEYGWTLLFEFLYTLYIFLRHGFDVIQGCNPPDNIFLVAIPFRWLGVKYIFDQHDVNPELYVSKYGKTGRLYKILVTLEALTYKHSDVVIATNQSYRAIAMGRGQKPENRVFVVRNGPDLRTFRPVAPKPELKYGKKYLVGYVGNMNFQDGLDILVEVAKRVKATGRSDVHFTCVGSGPELKTLREMVRNLGIDDTINFTGRVSDEVLLDVLSTADICVNPDRTSEMNDLSTMIKIMEYMALGKPIVQFESKEGRFSAQDASLYASSQTDFVEKILWLLDRPEERARMAEFGVRRVKDQLAWEHSVPHLLAAYQEALSGR